MPRTRTIVRIAVTSTGARSFDLPQIPLDDARPAGGRVRLRFDCPLTALGGLLRRRHASIAGRWLVPPKILEPRRAQRPGAGNCSKNDARRHQTEGRKDPHLQGPRICDCSKNTYFTNSLAAPGHGQRRSQYKPMLETNSAIKVQASGLFRNWYTGASQFEREAHLHLALTAWLFILIGW